MVAGTEWGNLLCPHLPNRRRSIMFWRKKDKPLTREDVGRLLQEAGSPDKLVLRGRNLKGIDLHRADLGGADLSGANLSGARPTLFGLERRSQSGANLRSA